MVLLRQLVRGTDFRDFADFVSPAFFDVMPATKLAATATTLVRDYGRKSAFEEAVRHRRRALAPVALTVDVDASAQDWTQSEAEGRIAVGQSVLEIYFRQLMDPDGPTLLNLGQSRFALVDGQPVWRPTRGHYRWPEAFRKALSNVYRTFYGGSGEQLAQALEPLNLAPAADIFGAHFGDGDQRAVRFDMKHFVRSFHGVFVCCKENGLRLDPAFLPLGLYLATMYETLQAVGLPLDVRAAYERATA